MKLFFACLLMMCCLGLTAQPADTRYFELRIYYAPKGKLDALIQRFQNHTTRIFESHGMENIGYWVPVKNDQNALYYILAYPNRNARKESWTAFGADPVWKDVQKKSEENGKLVDSVKSVFLNSADILPTAGVENGATGDRVFELRTYTCLPMRLPALITRFKEHTVALFTKHHMDNIAYFTTEEKENVQAKLVYILADQSVDAAEKSWAAFRADPEWIKTRDTSEKDGKIVEKVESVFLKPLSFSKIK